MLKSHKNAKIPKLTNRNWLKIAKIASISNNKFVIAIKCFEIMETILIFTLLNQFLVWMTKKNFLQFDLNLILTEYYKKRLKSQLKNKKTHINEKKLTKSIELLLPTYLFIFFN